MVVSYTLRNGLKEYTETYMQNMYPRIFFVVKQHKPSDAQAVFVGQVLLYYELYLNVSLINIIIKILYNCIDKLKNQLKGCSKTCMQMRNQEKIAFNKDSGLKH